jgi:hypothetical protein
MIGGEWREPIVFIDCLGSIEKLINNLLAFTREFGIKREGCSFLASGLCE